MVRDSNKNLIKNLMQNSIDIKYICRNCLVRNSNKNLIENQIEKSIRIGEKVVIENR